MIRLLFPLAAFAAAYILEELWHAKADDVSAVGDHSKSDRVERPVRKTANGARSVDSAKPQPAQRRKSSATRTTQSKEPVADGSGAGDDSGSQSNTDATKSRQATRVNKAGRAVDEHGRFMKKGTDDGKTAQKEKPAATNRKRKVSEKKGAEEK